MMIKIKKLFHDYLGWVYVGKRDGGDTFQPVYRCIICDKRIAQDSQGNFFHLSPF